MKDEPIALQSPKAKTFPHSIRDIRVAVEDSAALNAVPQNGTITISINCQVNGLNS
jgi:hypothetical protein